MEQAIRDLYQELLRLKANGTQSLYVDSQSIQALLAVRNQKNQQCGETVSIQSQHLSIKKSQEKSLSHTVTLPTKEKQLQPTNIQLPKGAGPSSYCGSKNSISIILIHSTPHPTYLDQEANKPKY